MPTLVVSTAGTSTFTNLAPPENLAFLRSTANHSTAAVAQLPDGERAQIETWIATRQQELADADIPAARRLSAELNGIVGFYDGQVSRGRGDHHILLTTDTHQGRAAGAAVASWLRARGLSAEDRVLDALTTSDLDAFREGIGALIHFCTDEVPAYRARDYRVVFNLVGGFKAVHAYAQSLGMIYADEILYLFEAPGAPLLRIPRLPMTLDLARIVQDHLRALRMLTLRLPVDDHTLQTLPETLLEPLSDPPRLSVWGAAAWREHHLTHYRRQILESPSPRVVFGPDFEASTKGLAADRIEILNQRIDQLARYQHTNRMENPRSLDVKSLYGTPHGATHEADAWGDSAAMRLFLRFDDERLILLRLGNHL
jgi:putative CRISPR-associated protein (TIGR02619 family)